MSNSVESSPSVSGDAPAFALFLEDVGISSHPAATSAAGSDASLEPLPQAGGEGGVALSPLPLAGGAGGGDLAAQPRTGRHNQWTRARMVAFLRELAATQSVAAAARAVGMSRTAAYNQRNRLAGQPFARPARGAMVFPDRVRPGAVFPTERRGIPPLARCWTKWTGCQLCQLALRHCEARSNEAIQRLRYTALDCFPRIKSGVAMTEMWNRRGLCVLCAFA